MNGPVASTQVKDIGRKAYAWILVADVALTLLLGLVGILLDAFTRELVLFLSSQFLLVLVLWGGYRYYELHRKVRPQALMAILSDAGYLALLSLTTIALWERVADGKVRLAAGALALVPLSLVVLDVLFWFALLRPDAWVSVRVQRFIAAGPLDRILPAQSPAFRAIQIGSVVIGLPILLGWLAVSAEWCALRPAAPPPDRASLEQEIARRDMVKSQEAPDVTIAVSLSGGAYRAAAFHTGVLEALDAARIPIDYLSVNSGGSIVGAYYGIGHQPGEFSRRFQAKPRLANDLFVAWEVLAGLVWPWYTSGEPVAKHFDRVLFAGSTFPDRCYPLLLVNAVPYESGQVDTARCPSDPAHPGIPERRAAWAVAASAAIAGLFEPVEINAKRYMDGAARDNLGLEGLKAYLRDNPAKPIPRVLLISNASMTFEAETNPPPKIWRLLSLIRGNVTLLDEVRNLLFSRHTKGRYEPGIWANQPFRTAAEDLYDSRDTEGPKLRDAGIQGPEVYVFVVSLHPEEYPRIQAADGCRNGAAVEDAAKFSSIEEPSPKKFEEVRCVGHWLMASRVEEVRCVIKALQAGDRDPIRRCPPTR